MAKRILQCKLCEFSCSSPWDMRSHKEEKHKDQIKRRVTKRSKEKEVNLVACPKCGCRLDIVRKALEMMG